MNLLKGDKRPENYPLNQEQWDHYSNCELDFYACKQCQRYDRILANSR